LEALDSWFDYGKIDSDFEIVWFFEKDVSSSGI